MSAPKESHDPPPPSDPGRESAVAGASTAAAARFRRQARWHKWVVIAVAASIALWLVVGDPGKAVRTVAARYWVAKAVSSHQANDLPKAIGEIDRAMDWIPDEPACLEYRAALHAEVGDLAASLEDYNRLIESSPEYGPAYARRSTVFTRLGRHREAIDDCTESILLGPEGDAESWNRRAYARALAGIEIDEALTDIQRALALQPGENAAFLDTRGFLRFQSGDLAPALDDLNRAVELAEAERKEQLDALEASGAEGSVVEDVTEAFDHYLAVMYHHRGLVHREMGEATQADEDLDRGQRLGYDPQNGVY